MQGGAVHGTGALPWTRLQGARECIGCGHCDSRCPFGVAQSERMGRIAEHFGL